MFSFPRTTTIRELQRNYKKVFNEAKKSKKPIIVMKNNKPDVAVIDVKTLQELEKKIEELELEDAINSAKQGEKEYREGKTVKASSLSDLL